MASSGTTGPALARLSTKDVRPLLGSDPLFSQGQNAGEIADPEVQSLQAARLHGPPIIFLGLHEHDDGTGESSHALPSTEFSAKKDAEAVVANIHGTPYFSVDVSDIEEGRVNSVLDDSEGGRNGVKLEFLDGRAAMGSFTQFDSAVFSEARSLVDWSARNRVSDIIISPFMGILTVHIGSTALVAAHLSTLSGPAGNTLVRLFYPGPNPPTRSHALQGESSFHALHRID